jgi:hypothetical protein
MVSVAVKLGSKFQDGKVERCAAVAMLNRMNADMVAGAFS